MRIIIPLFLLLIYYQSNAQQWVLEKDKNGIKVFTIYNPTSAFKEFRGEVIINKSVEEISSTIMDIENYPKWGYKTKATKVIKREKDAVYFYYLSENPPIVKNREGYFLYQQMNNDAHGTTIIKMSTFDPKVPIPKNFVRIPVSYGTWTISTISTTKSKVLFQMQAEPGGNIPAWLANLVVVDSPFVTLSNLRLLLTNKN